MGGAASSDLAFEAALERCASEPVHIPERIQGHGAIIAVDNRTLRITHGSANLAEITGLGLHEVLGETVQDVFPADLAHDLVNGLLSQSSMQENRILGVYDLDGKSLYIGSANAKDATIFEFEAVNTLSDLDSTAVDLLELLTSQLGGVRDRKSLFDKSVMLLKILTGYNRVMVYEFDPEGNGMIQAEALSGPGPSFLGLNFPAWDIPEQARAIMCRTLFRYIADVGAEPTPIFAADDEDGPLDMTFSHLRGVSPVHMEYLRNMGTGATFTLNIMVSGKLWGMISMHSTSARFPGPSIREVCRNFAGFFALKLETILLRQRHDRLNEAAELRKKLVDTASRRNTGSMFDEELLKLVCNAMNADGMMLVSDGDVLNLGLSVPPGCQEALLRFGRDCEKSFHSSAVPEELENYVEICGTEIAGLHITPVPGDGFVAFFRRGRDYATTWAGVPEKDVESDGETFKLTPRASFEAYKMVVCGTSLPWTMEEHQIASDIWAILISSERNALIEKTTRQQELLIAELNHRVRNMLSLIRSLSRQSRSSAKDLDDYIRILDARIEAVASAHSLAVEKAGSSVSVRRILELEAAPYGDEGARCHVRGDDFGIKPDVAPIFALVIHELMTNAAKYGALSAAEGQVQITMTPSEGGVEISWKEMGGPRVSQPKHNGFGTVLISNTVPNELRGTYRMRFLKSGVEVTITLPDDILSQKRVVGQVEDLNVDRGANLPAKTPPIKPRADIRCLLVEDSFVVSMDTIRVMNDVGFVDIHTALTKREGLRSVESNKPDFAILDVSLSGGDTSFDIAEKLHALGLPFIFVTGYGEDGVPRATFPHTHVLKKPLQKADLEKALQALGL